MYKIYIAKIFFITLV